MGRKPVDLQSTQNLSKEPELLHSQAQGSPQHREAGAGGQILEQEAQLSVPPSRPPLTCS